MNDSESRQPSRVAAIYARVSSERQRQAETGGRARAAGAR